MKREFYKTMYRLLAGATRRVNWRWLNEWKVAMGISLIAAGCVGAGKKPVPGKGSAETMIATLQEIREATEERNGMTCYVFIEDMPEFPGGNLSTYIKHQLHYPKEALKDEATGKVYVQFVIEKDGSIKQVKIVRGVHPALDSAAVEVISQLPKFRPAKARGKAIEYSFTIPVHFTSEMIEKAKTK